MTLADDPPAIPGDGSPGFIVERLGRRHDCAGFSCGRQQLDDYLKQYAGQDERRDVARVYVMVPVDEPSTIAGYYAISSYGIEPEATSPDIQAKLPRYPLVPALLIGRLAIATSYQGRRLGRWLLMDAMATAVRLAELGGGVAVVVDALDEEAAAFYERFGFLRTTARPDRLYLPMATVRAAVMKRQG